MAIKIGDTVGDYRVVDLAGSGGMGSVYRIEHLITKRVEAMKVLPTGIGSVAEDIRRFEREIEVQARLHHPNIVALYNAVRDDQSIALIMEYVEGESLHRILQGGKLPLQTAFDYACQVLDALSYAHAKGVIHRDVSPANIIITPEGTAKLTDFGLALPANDVRLTSPGIAMGSAWYMSPEQVRAEHQIDNRTDLYAMGAVLHEMLTGKKLFDADGSFAIMGAQLETVPRPPSAVNSEFSGAIDEVVARSLTKDPAARFQSADEFRMALEAAVAGLPRTSAVHRIRGAQKAMRHSRLAMVLVIAPAALVAAMGLAIWPQAKHLVVGRNVRPDSVPRPAPVMAPPSAATPDLSISSKPAARTAAPSAAHTTKQTLAIPGSGKAQPPEPGDSLLEPASDEGTPQKTGNRFIRALSKLNPFHRGAKNVSAEP